MLPLVSYQKLSSHIDGTFKKPSETIEVDNKMTTNPLYTTWLDLDQKALILLNSSLTEESASKVIGLTTAQSIWIALESAYSNSSIE